MQPNLLTAGIKSGQRKSWKNNNDWVENLQANVTGRVLIWRYSHVVSDRS